MEDFKVLSSDSDNKDGSATQLSSKPVFDNSRNHKMEILFNSPDRCSGRKGTYQSSIGGRSESTHIEPGQISRDPSVTSALNVSFSKQSMFRLGDNDSQSLGDIRTDSNNAILLNNSRKQKMDIICNSSDRCSIWNETYHQSTAGLSDSADTELEKKTFSRYPSETSVLNAYFPENSIFHIGKNNSQNSGGSATLLSSKPVFDSSRKQKMDIICNSSDRCSTWNETYHQSNAGLSESTHTKLEKKTFSRYPSETSVLNAYFPEESIFHIGKNNSQNSGDIRTEVSDIGLPWHLDNANETIWPVTSAENTRYKETHYKKCNVEKPTSKDADGECSRPICPLESEITPIEQRNRKMFVSHSDKNQFRKRLVLSRQHSLSDSDIVKSVDNPKSSLTSYSSSEDLIGNDEISDIKRFSVGRYISFENLKGLPLRLCKRGKTGATFQQPLQSDMHLQNHGNLSCCCGENCKYVGSVAVAPGGRLWVSFNKCSKVVLYDNKYREVKVIHVKGSIDSIAVSSANTLYISCPKEKRIFMLKSTLKIALLHQSWKFHPRNMTISPRDDSLIVCMTTQQQGHIMHTTSDNCLKTFSGQKPGEKGRQLNKANCFGYPWKVAVNEDGLVLVADYGLQRIVILTSDGMLLTKLTALCGQEIFDNLAVTCYPDNSFLILQGLNESLEIIQLKVTRDSIEQMLVLSSIVPEKRGRVRSVGVVDTSQLVIASTSSVGYLLLNTDIRE